VRLSRLFSPFRLTLLGVLLCAVTVGILSINPQKASADACAVNGRDCYFGYFYNGYDPAPPGTRWNVIDAPALLNVHNRWDFINTISAYLAGCTDNNSQNQTGAALIVLTMLSAPPGTPKWHACARFNEWTTYVHILNDANLIRYDQIHNFGGINTRSNKVDVHWYQQSGSSPSIVIYDPNTGLPIYAIKKDCANPIGKLGKLTLNYQLQPSITTTVNGAASTGTAEAGDTVQFIFRINNNGNTNSPTVNCDAHNVNHSGYFPTPASPEPGGPNIPTSCPMPFWAGTSTQVAAETVTATANTTVCRTLFVEPATHSGGRNGTEVCIPVVSKPYLSVFGGDVAAGGGVEASAGTCTTNPNAAIVAWNKNTAGYAGAGVQYAALAMNTIRGFATAQNSPAGGANAPVGLSFSSTTQNGPTEKYGGDFQAAKCIKDYYGQKPASATALTANTNIPATSGVYATPVGTSAVLNSGTVANGQKITIFVDGDLFVNGNILYAGGSTYDQIPLLQLVVRGNIHIRNTATRLDGVYIAQPLADLTKGYVYTCSTDSTPPFDAPIINNGAFYSSCTNKLTVNGSVVARDIQFLRTSGTLRQSNPGETSASNNAAEVFNYGPAFWITQPTMSTTNDGSVDNYDAITSLAPIL
jgi:hypothetical protein